MGTHDVDALIAASHLHVEVVVCVCSRRRWIYMQNKVGECEGDPKDLGQAVTVTA